MEFRRLAQLIEVEKPRSLHADVRFLVLSSRSSYALVQRSDFLDVLKAFGVQITLDTCIFHCPIVPRHTKVLMTDSGKCAYYAPGELGVQVALGSVADCVRSAVEGHVCRKESPWNGS